MEGGKNDFKAPSKDAAMDKIVNYLFHKKEDAQLKRDYAK